MPRALITGITGQDGSYLAEFLLKKGYEVYGIHREASTGSWERIKNFMQDVNLLYGDLSDDFSIEKAIKEAKPDEVYNLAAMSQVGVSFKMPKLTRYINYESVVKMLKILKKNFPKAKFYQASSSEMFGNSDSSPKNEESPFNPVNPYGESKRDAHLLIQKFRKEMFCVGGILFNHESPRRGLNYVTRKISHGVAKIKLGLDNKIILGNLNSERDWGFAPEYVEAMWLMLQQEKPEDFVIATGKTHSVKDFLDNAFKMVNLKYEIKDFSDKTSKEANDLIKKLTGGPFVVVHPDFFRPVDINSLVGDPSKANEKLGWKAKTDFKELVKIMVESDLKLLGEEND